MITIRLKAFSSLICSACDDQHQSSSELLSATPSYLCNLCGYWIHPNCASLPNAILHYEYHHRSLFLTYNLPNVAYSRCQICRKEVKNTSGGYICPDYPYYVIHMRCALTRPKSFKPVFIRDAEVSDLPRLPMSDEDTSLIPYLVGSNEDTSLIRYINRNSSVDDDDDDGDDIVLVHQHPLTLHEIDDGDQPISSVCNACVQFVSPPFLSCSECPGFFLHRSCANLPAEIEHLAYEHTLYYILKHPDSDISGGFSYKGCGFRCNGFAYICICCDNYSMDVFCALINPAITHDSYKKTHILFMSRNINFGSNKICNCCSSVLSGICYECNISINFKLHARCAMLPNTVTHLFDNHTLHLITTGAKKKIAIATSDDDDDDICEVCEEDIEKKHWHYGCKECDQLFHIDCIPSVDRLSRIKLGSTISVDGHACILALVRDNEAVSWGRPCGVCGEILKSSNDGLAYECSNCLFGIHHNCAV